MYLFSGRFFILFTHYPVFYLSTHDMHASTVPTTEKRMRTLASSTKSSWLTFSVQIPLYDFTFHNEVIVQMQTIHFHFIQSMAKFFHAVVHDR